MIFGLMVLSCLIWGLWCGENNVPTAPMILGAALIGLVSHFIELGIGV